MKIPAVGAAELIDRYPAMLLDSFGVLVSHRGAISGAAAFVRRLNALGRRPLVVTNDASRRPDRLARWYAEVGIEIAADQILSSGHLLVEHFACHGLVGARCAVLGSPDSEFYVSEAGGEVVPLTSDVFDAVVVCDDAGYPLLETLDHIISLAIRAVSAGRQLALILPNPDLIYPKGGGEYGITAGSIALVIEAALGVRFSQTAPQFVRLGKPYAPIFAEAQRRLGTSDMLMIGDQLATDIAGAADFGIDSALVTTGVNTAAAEFDGPHPTWILESLAVTGADLT